MAIFEEQLNPGQSSLGAESIYNIEFDETGKPRYNENGECLAGTTSWEEKSGKNVEDYITRRLNQAIVGGRYKDTKLILTKGDGEDLDEITITLAPTTYDYGMVFFGIRVNGKVYNSESLLMQYKKDSTVVEAGIAIRSVAQTLDNISNNNGRFNVTFTFNGNKCTREVRNINKDYFTELGNNFVLNFPEGINGEEVVVWVDISELFKKRTSGAKITAEFTPPDQNKVSTQLNTSITNEVIELKYVGDVISKQNYAQVQFTNESNISDYNLVVFINNSEVKEIVGTFKIEGLVPGLNQIVVRAEHTKNKLICTDWLNFDIIYTEGFDGTAIAVNGVSSGITNNGVATLYKLFVYSTSREEIELTTYLEDNIPASTDPKPTQIIKSEFIQASSYKRETNATEELSYKKYIEVESSGTLKYLLIKYNGQFYQFKTPSYSNVTGSYLCSSSPFIQMAIEQCIPEYTYIKKYNIVKNYDQITGQINNLFSTDLQSSEATLISDLESSDGWKERDGITYLKLSKQGKNVLKNDIDLQLNDNFTIEMGFRTYNISDKSQSILNIGSLTLYPTQLGWEYNEGIISENFLKRNAQFQEGQDTHITITVTKNWTISKDDPYYPDYLGTAQSTFDQKVVNTKFNLMRIYINGCIDREIILEDTELNELKRSKLQINPKSADIDLYLFRVYNSQPLSHSEVIQNYISFLPLKTGELSKESIYNQNDILDESGKVSWSKCQGKVNTLLFIYHKGGIFPNRFWGQEDNLSDNDKNKKVPCTLIINYADPVKNAKYGGILDKLQCKGQGSSAMRYLIWNVNSSLNKFKYPEFDEEGNPVIDSKTGKQKEKKAKSKFKPFGKLWIDEELTNLVPENTSETYNVVEGYYPMPTYDGEKDTTDYEYTKMVGKVNFASSMQSHKIGACKLYDDAYKASLGIASLPSGGKKAVHEEPFLYFYIESDIEFDKVDKWKSEIDSDSITYDKILELAEQAKFMGFQTWGPGKGDDACSGFDEDKTPHYLMLEGGENTDPSVNFQRPWQALQRLRPDFVRDGTKYQYGKDISDLKPYPTVKKNDSIKDPSARLLIDDESIVYMNRGAWDIDYGFEEVEVGDGDNKTTYYDIPENGSRESLKIFRDFYDSVYKWDFTCVFVPSSITSPQADWQINKKYCVLANKGQFKIDGVIVSTHQPGDVYRFDEPSNTWVPAGVYYDYTDDTKPETGQWERLNYVEEIYKEVGEPCNASEENRIKNLIKYIFKKKMNGTEQEPGGFLRLDDVAFHQAFIKFLSGTDNRAKNTYFQIIGPIYEEVGKVDTEGNPVLDEDGKQETEFVIPAESKIDYKIRLIGDDLDTILVTDNNGLQSKPYNLIEDSYDESFYDHWGDVGNLFFRMFDKCYETQIRGQLKNIMTTAGLKPSSVNDKSSYFYKQFFKVQEDFPAIAYNNTATIYYENAQLIKNSAGGESIYGFNYTNNDVKPIEQSHGSCLQGEKQFMKERIAFLAGYAGSVESLDNSLSTASSAGVGKTLKLKMSFEPAQDFYPTYQYEKGSIKQIGSYSESEYDIVKYKAETGKQYEKVINESNSAINQNLFQVNLYKTLSINGLQINDIDGNLASTTELSIDNNVITNDNTGLFDDEYPVLNLAKFSANLPVVEKLSLRNLSLPSELNLGSFYKLQTLDLSGSQVYNVTFPQSGSFVKAILPPTIKTFELYNNPKLSEVIFENTGSLQTIYVECSRCEAFNVADFCENLNPTSLTNVTLKNLNNVYLTEEAFRKLLVQNCTLTGEITIIESIGSTTPKTISFKTKQELVNLFGDIVNGTNGLKINFTPEIIRSTFTCNQEASAFYDSTRGGEQTFSNLYNIDFSSGNNVAIINEINPSNEKVIGYLDISYSLNKTVPNVSIHNRTGVITLKGPVTEEVVVKIQIKTISNNTFTGETRVSFAWKAPEIGNFAYADGTFSSYYNSSKTLVGLVYAKNEIDENKGTVYIIGKEYSNNTPHYSGFTSCEQNSEGTNDSDPKNIYLTNQYMQTLVGVNAPYQPNGVSQGSNANCINSISAANYNDIKKLALTGKDDTLAYVNLVNGTLLGKLVDVYYEYVEHLNNGYYIANTDKLNALCEEISYIGKGSKYDSALLYPYFYSAYVYQPAVSNGETLSEQYARGNWYAPSVGEWSRILYYRGYSAGGPSFTADYVCEDIQSDTTNGGTEATIPIFSIAQKSMNYAFPAVWKSLAGDGFNGTVDNITTTVTGTASDADNYSYQVYTYNTEQRKVWTYGTYTTNWSSSSRASLNTWRYTKHQGIPFVEFVYQNPTS